MQLAFSTAIGPRRPPADTARAATEWQYDGFELSALYGQAALDADTARTWATQPPAGALLAVLDTGISLCNPDRAAWKFARERIRQTIALAAEVRCPFVLIPPGQAPARARRDALLGTAGGVLADVCQSAAERGVSVLIENGESFPNTLELWHLREAIDAPVVRFCWNALASHLSGEPPSIAVPRLSPALAFVHLGDAAVEPDGTRRYVPLGDGAIDIPKIIELLKGIAYRGWVCAHWPTAAEPALASVTDLLPQARTRLAAELAKSVVVLSAYKGDKYAPRFPAGAPAAT